MGAMSKKYRQYFLKTKDAKALLREASEKLKIDLDEIFNAKVNVELVETAFGEIFLLNDKPSLVKIGGHVFPTLLFSEVIALAPKVVVDMGAVPHICNGADIMAPGIVRFEGEFREGDLVFVVDEKYGKPIAIGEAVSDVDAARKATQGVIVKNIHFVGDTVWNFIKTWKTG
jgi:PUA domain protein